uniref:Uncharacterized protein n=1 Tax=Arundo donax TaxID=35708 RepID=A0A0A9FXH5_ARUDO
MMRFKDFYGRSLQMQIYFVFYFWSGALYITRFTVCNHTLCHLLLSIHTTLD